MKLIIDISEETYEYWKTHKDEYVLAEAIQNGIPLDDVKAEIADYKGSHCIYHIDPNDLVDEFLSIIDKHIGGKEC